MIHRINISGRSHAPTQAVTHFDPALAIAFGAPVFAQEAALGANVDSLINYAKTRNPEYAAMQAEAEASGERVTPAGALPDPKFRTELRDITRFGEQNATLSPSRVGSTRYLLMQDIPWFGKRDLKREIAELEADGAKGRALGTWADVAGRIKVNFAQLYYVHRNEQLTREILDLMTRLEKSPRYAIPAAWRRSRTSSAPRSSRPTCATS
jgi:cobalt-zinc-cadmium efflux system outer membrane protein